jgi:hypothetical protein
MDAAGCGAKITASIMKRTLTIAAISLVAITCSAQWLQPEGVPAYHPAPPAKNEQLPPILAGKDIENFQHPVMKKSYIAAAKASKVIYQLPCYCYCDRGHGHKSLHSCFESEHGANCSTCMQEALFAEQEMKKGKTAAQIRAEIMRGDYKKIDLVKLDNAS